MRRQNTRRHIHSTRIVVLLLMAAMLMASALQNTTTCVSNRCSADSSTSDSACHCGMGENGGNSCAMSATEHESLRRGCNCIMVPNGLNEAIVESGSRPLQRDHAVNGDKIPAIIRSHRIDPQECTRLAQHPPNRSGPVLLQIRSIILRI